MPVTVKTFATSGEAAAALSSERDARYLGGGTLVMRALNEGDLTVSTIVRATDRALAHLDVASPRITVGAGVTFARVLAERELAFLHPVAGSIGGPAVRNMGTVGGNLFAPAPFGDFTVALLALGATVALQGGYGARDVPIEEFLAGRGRMPAGLVLSVSFQRPSSAEAFRYRKIARIKPKGGSVVTLAAQLPSSGGRINGARIALGAMAATAVRAKTAERALEAGARDAASIAAAVAAAAEGTSPVNDSLASAWYRREVVGVHLRRLLTGQERGKPEESTRAKTAVQFRHNGRDVAVFVDGGVNLLATLRDLVGDMTPKFGCGQGGCGACTVLIDGDAHLACLTLAESVEGRSVETLDGLKDGPNLHPLQRAFMEHFAAQCGYCTPGMLMAAKALLDHNPQPSREEVVNAIAGNICRCTGYEPIINAVLAAASGGRARA